MIEKILLFLDANPNLVFVSAGVILLSISSSIVGTFTFLRKKALIGDAIAHSILPGICLAFMLGGSKNPLFIIPGAFLSGWLSVLSIDWISNNSKIKEDTAIALILSVFFGFGILLMVSIQHSGNANQSGLNTYLFGNAASLIGEDLISFSLLSIILIITVGIFYKELKIICFDREHAVAIGMPVKSIEFILSTLTVLAIVAGIQAIGVVLMAAMLITPAATARYWTQNLLSLLFVSAIVASLASLGGTLISFSYPSMPTGPWIVVLISFLAILSFFIAPKKGIISKYSRMRRNKLKILKENILKSIYHLNRSKTSANAENQVLLPIELSDLSEFRYWQQSDLSKGLKKLKNEGYLELSENKWKLTPIGYKKGERVVRLHRLWELYLTKYLKIASDHVHEDAETIEHVITPELEKNILQTLNYPELDPHQSKIPYQNE